MYSVYKTPVQQPTQFSLELDNILLINSMVFENYRKISLTLFQLGGGVPLNST